MFKRVFLFSFYLIYLTVTKKSFFKSLNRNKKNYIFDIDNTVANTWPTLNLEWKSEVERLSQIRPIEKIILEIKFLEKSNNIIYLTARDFRFKDVTVNWLRNQGLYANYKNVYLVPNPTIKYKWLRAIGIHYDVVFIDDMSYNHENGIVKYYESIINKIIKLPIRYIGYSEIQKFITNNSINAL